MKLLAALLIALTSSSASCAELCEGIARATAPDMQIQESELTKEAAVKAAEGLRGMIERGALDGDYQFGALNALKTVKGYILRHQALTDRRTGPGSAEAEESKVAFCKWLVSDGFWYD